MWWIQTNAGLLWDTVVHSRWRKLKSCNYVFLWGHCSDSQIFIKARCSRCDDHMLALIHHQKLSLSSPFCWWALFFHWAVWFKWCIDHHFLQNMHGLCCGWLECSCPYTVAQLGDILSYPSEQMPAKSNSGVLPVWKTVLSLPQFPYCYEIIDEEKPTHAGCSQKQLMLQATAHAWPFNHT